MVNEGWAHQKREEAEKQQAMFTRKLASTPTNERMVEIAAEIAVQMMRMNHHLEMIFESINEPDRT